MCVCVCVCVCVWIDDCTVQVYVSMYVCTYIYYVLINPPTHPTYAFLPFNRMGKNKKYFFLHRERGPPRVPLVTTFKTFFFIFSSLYIGIFFNFFLFFRWSIFFRWYIYIHIYIHVDFFSMVHLHTHMDFFYLFCFCHHIVMTSKKWSRTELRPPFKRLKDM